MPKIPDNVGADNSDIGGQFSPLKMNKRRGKGLSVDQLLKFMPMEPDIVNSRHVYFTKIRKTTLVSGKRPRLVTETITRIPTEKETRQHKQQIYAKDRDYKGSLNKCDRVIVDCDCARYKFRWSYALRHHGAGMDTRSNGEFPVKTNPQLIPAACKHVFKLLKLIKARNF